MNIETFATPEFLNAPSATATSPLLDGDLEKNVAATSVKRDTFVAGGALVLVACAAQGVKCSLKQPEFKPTTKYTEVDGIV